MKKSLRLLILLLLALLIPTTSLPVFSLEIFSAATAPTVTQLSISGAPEDLTSGQLLPQPQLTLLADNPCAIVPLDSTGETVRWYAGQASEPLPLDTIVQAGQTYWMELLVRPAQGETIDPARLRCTVNAVSPSISETEDGVLLRICYSASTSQPVNSDFPFTDIPRSSWYYDSVSWAYHHALVAGTSATGFSPAGTTTRAMLVTLLYRLAGSPENSDINPFTDVPADTWYTKAVCWAAENSIVAGMSPTRFAPNSPVTREQMAVFLYRYAKFRGLDTSLYANLDAFPDASQTSRWANDGMCWAVSRSLLSGVATGGQIFLQPKAVTTRCQLAAMMERFSTRCLLQVQSNGQPTIGYIPLDNRPVNDLRPVYLMQNLGYTVKMPSESDYATRMDHQTLNPNGTTYGNRQGLLDWLERNAGACDLFIVSLDQMTSGGLVNSRVMSNQNLQLEYTVIDALAKLAQQKPVYIFDTVMRLASTVGYQNLGNAEYTAFRNYGMQPRKPLSGSALTLQNIYAGYRYNEQGAAISTTLSEELLIDYHNARIRKLRLTDYLLQSGENFAGILIGVDDSAPGNSIQSNEIAYLRQRLTSNATLFYGTDELGMMSVCQAYLDRYQYQPKVAVQYFGGHEDTYTDVFDNSTLRQAVESHLQALGCDIVTANAGIQLLVLTKNCDAAAIDTFYRTWRSNCQSGIPTIVIDTARPKALENQILDELPTQTLYGYSSWGTNGNAIGLALSMGLSRLAQADCAPQIRPQENEMFARQLIFAFIKDVAYRGSVQYAVSDLSPKSLEKTVCGSQITTKLLQNLQGSQLQTASGKQSTYLIPTISLTDFSAPLNRRAEIRFDIHYLYPAS